MNGVQRTANSNPAKVGRLVLAVAELDDPPLRILDGSDGYQYAPASEQPYRHSA
jgi:hypothetical protein